MNVRLAVLADAANVSTNRKLNVLGMFSRIVAPAFPASIPAMVLVLRLELNFDDGQGTGSVPREHKLRVELQDPDSRVILKVEKPISVVKIPAGDHGYHDEVIQFAGVTLKKETTLAWVVFWNQREKTRIPMEIRLAASRPA